jgi:putative endonuclease
MRSFFVYILTNHSRTLYTGVTNDLERRVREHKIKLRRGFTSKYRINRLVWFEDFYNIDEALVAEKRIKGWRRAKKIALIDATNPLWLDLADQLTGHVGANPPKTLRLTSG